MTGSSSPSSKFKKKKIYCSNCLSQAMFCTLISYQFTKNKKARDELSSNSYANEFVNIFYHA